MKKLTLMAATFLFVAASYAQKPVFIFQGYPDSDENLDPKKIHKWLPPKLSSYSGIYHFGESEGEWDLLVIASDSGLVLQCFNNEWGKVDGSETDTWRKSIQVARNVKVVNNKFSSDVLTGYFMNYESPDGPHAGIILPNNPPNTPMKFDTVEFGGRQESDVRVFRFFEGNYPELSYKLCDDDYFKTRTKDELQLMRNEIYARYGQRFAKNGKMYAYFSKRQWYQPFRDNVQMCLTEIELKNIAKIKAFSSL